jgi:glutathione S-transferase
MPAKLYVLHGSHPCVTVELALQIKGVPFKAIELPMSMQPVVVRALRFDRRTVPAIRFEDGERVQGSRAIIAALDRRVPQPQLGINAEVAAAEQWGDEVLQDIPRRLIWYGFNAHRGAMHGFQEGQKRPKLPRPIVIAASPLILGIEQRLNNVTDATVQADLQALPNHLDRIDAWIEAGVLNGDQPNAADLQIAPTIGLLYALEDVRPLIEGRPAEAFAFRWVDRPVASVPAGALPVQADVPAATLPAG